MQPMPHGSPVSHAVTGFSERSLYAVARPSVCL